MNIGGRIQERLKQLGWERNDLMDRIPELSPAALSALIRRDSKRTEFDEAIADALGVDVLWLVYGRNSPSHSAQEPGEQYSLKLTADEQHLLDAFRAASPDAQAAAMMWARTVLPTAKEPRTGTR